MLKQRGLKELGAYPDLRIALELWRAYGADSYCDFYPFADDGQGPGPGAISGVSERPVVGRESGLSAGRNRPGWRKRTTFFDPSKFPAVWPPPNPPLERTAAAVYFTCGRASRVRRRGRSTALRYACPSSFSIQHCDFCISRPAPHSGQRSGVMFPLAASGAWQRGGTADKGRSN